ncbi:L-fucose/L-arabinose isomerase family protein [Bacillus daqingensis]|uniref:L-fucose/L-arabinose isomerase family protein n=1 Tax=Bacillus daqingensis TaxID=872396 RepID=A0ABV9NU92_9BACI
MLNVLYLPIARKTFNTEAADQLRIESEDLLRQSVHVLTPGELVTSPDELEVFLNNQETEIDLIVYQSLTFADGEFIQAAIDQFNAPVIVWSVREPAVGGRLQLNSLTGGNSTSHVLRSNNHSYSFLFGNPDEEATIERLTGLLRVMNTVREMKKLNIGVVGEHPPGFYFSGTETKQLQAVFGAEITKVDLYEAFSRAKEMPEEKWKPEVDIAEKNIMSLNRNDETVKRFAQFTAAMRDYIGEKDLSALAIRCWPDFFNELGAAACSTLSHLTDESMVSACESDIHGSLSMFILNRLSGGKAPYLGDMVHINEENNALVFWHCGAGAYSLAREATGAQPGVHPNRKLGLTMEFGLKAGEVTLFRVGHTPEGYRLLVFKGEALDVPQRFDGTTVEVAVKQPVQQVMQTLMEEGFEPHYALVHADVTNEIKEIGRLLNLPIVEIEA